MPYGQVVIGPPGVGKTSYCYGLCQLFSGIERTVKFVNLDPASNQCPFEPQIDIQSIYGLEEVMKTYNLGPNGAMLKCMHLVLENFDNFFGSLLLLEEGNGENEEEDPYVVIDCPGQVELFTCDEALPGILHRLQRKLNFTLVTVHLMDISLCINEDKFLAAQLLALQSMLLLECPHVNVLTKMDLASQLQLPFNAEHYCNATLYTAGNGNNPIDNNKDDSTQSNRYSNLRRALKDYLNDQPLVRFVPLAVEDKECMLFLMGEIDRASGIIFSNPPEHDDKESKEDEEDQQGIDKENRHLQDLAMGERTWEDLVNLMNERYFDYIHLPPPGDS